MLVEAEVEGEEKRKCSIILQNAETIKLMGTTKPISVVDLKEGAEAMVHVTETSRQFVLADEGMVMEKRGSEGKGRWGRWAVMG